ncbi:uncharacterized protein MEPE_02072 [Melanopsichium pennsylvanicum]|uniref:Uncharacterized protein n=2 Tax=Melanopsichium pennsylvanicum TaxID=63383 RepID=A0AAJ4XJK4_9BASI|nr:putative protein [Melanopsichium pennsylvanicum 4]SNX83365.1 uncharacterized protein MEPE_02072 [Melanopsichium pennsylvanicum]
MGVSSTARLPSLGAQSIPPLFNHLQHTSNAKVVARWSITIRSFRAVTVPANAWPATDLYDHNFDPRSSSSFSSRANDVKDTAPASGSFSNQTGNPGVGGGGSGAPALTKPRTMWQVWLSDYPGAVFVVVEDTGRVSRAKVWRDWEVGMKKWKREKRKEIEVRKKSEEKAQQGVQIAGEQSIYSTTSANVGAAANEKNAEDETKAPIKDATPTADNSEPMDVDAAASAPDPPKSQSDLSASAIVTSLSTFTSDQASRTGPITSLEQFSPSSPIEESVPLAGPRPTLNLPSHTRYTVSALTSSLSAMLTGLNLPPPHGAPVGTAGPGAWVPRGAAVSIEGLVLEINSQSLNALPGISPALASVSTMDDLSNLVSGGDGKGDGGRGGVDWRVRVGSVVGGGGRSAGAIVEAEFLPVSKMLPESRFMEEFLFSLFPPGLIPSPPPAPANGMAHPPVMRGMSRTVSATGTPRMTSSSVPLSPVANGNAVSLKTMANGSGFGYTIGAGATAPPNRNFNIPIVSDQLWEEVVPRSGEGWRKRIVKRSHQMRIAARAQRRQRKMASPTASSDPGNKKHTKSGVNGGGNDNLFGWQAFGSDAFDEAEPSLAEPRNWEDDDNEDSLSSSDSETEQPLLSATSATGVGGLMGTTVTMQQNAAGDEDDDDDDDRPLGAPTWSNVNRSQSSIPLNSANPFSSATGTAPTPIPTVDEGMQSKKEDTVQLIFQGLRPDDDNEANDGGDGDGWTGIERGRRIAFQYVQMLRAEGII